MLCTDGVVQWDGKPNTQRSSHCWGKATGRGAAPDHSCPLRSLHLAVSTAWHILLEADQLA